MSKTKPQLKLFTDFLLSITENHPYFDFENWIQISESEDENEKYALKLFVPYPGLLRKVAQFFGCPDNELPLVVDQESTASSSWHGKGKGNLRDLADELIDIYGPFFDIGYRVKNWKKISDKHNGI